MPNWGGVSISLLISHVNKFHFWQHFNITSIFIQLHDLINNAYDYGGYYDEKTGYDADNEEEIRQMIPKVSKKMIQ